MNERALFLLDVGVTEQQMLPLPADLGSTSVARTRRS